MVEELQTVPVSEAAELLGVTPSHVHLLVRGGHLDFVRSFDGPYEITRESIDSYRRRRGAR